MTAPSANTSPAAGTPAATAAAAMSQASQPVRRPRRGRQVRSGMETLLVYVLLIVVGVVVVFPFAFMLANSLKTGPEVSRFPPTLLPQAPKTVTIEGQAEPLPVYAIPVDGVPMEMVPIQVGIAAGVFLDPAAPTAQPPLAWPLEFATPVLTSDGQPETVVIDGTPLALFDVSVNGDVQRLAKERETAVAEFIAVGDPEVVSYAVLRTAVPVESPTAHPENYDEVLARVGFARNLTNTMLVTMAVVIGQLVTSILGGFAFARIRFPGRDRLFFIYLGSIMVPFVVLIIPLYQLMVAIGWVDKIASLVFPWLITAYGTFLMRQFFITVPKELEEAAIIDGASRWTILWRIFVPLSLPAVATLTTFSFLYAWNSFVWPFVVISGGNVDAQVLTVALQQFVGRAQDAPQLIFAGVTIAVTVPVIAFILVQRYYVANVSTSGIK